MKNTHEPSMLIEKERIRMMIIAQVDDFLRSGGEISVLSSPGQSARGSVGCGWQDQDDIPQLIE
jgi:hypothetical protein